ncbi:hypothetical protein [Erwinia sp. V71]|uniref:hypothetical protein n=1 Tax=Erwinia sp. V71 TaxID=3369424 RepID=UPI003F5F5349
MRHYTKKVCPGLLSLVSGISFMAHAEVDLYHSDTTKLTGSLFAAYAMFDSQKTYFGDKHGSTSWREGFAKYGLAGEQKLAAAGTLYGSTSLVSSGTWGSGDAGGYTNGSERTTRFEDAYVGWKSADLFPELGDDGINMSFGRQAVIIGDGFIMGDDGLNTGRSPLFGDGANRGGAYYLAARHAYHDTAVLKLSSDAGWNGTLAWLKSENPMTASSEMAVSDWSYQQKGWSLGFMYAHGLDVNREQAITYNPVTATRKGMNIYSLRGKSSLGVDNLNLAFEYAIQDKKYRVDMENSEVIKDDNSDNAWYTSASYTFANIPWSPEITYRYSRYSRNWDAMFNASSGYGTWYQGEVAANYAGPYNSNDSVNHAGLKLHPLDNVTAGILYFKFKTLYNRDVTNLDAQELDIFTAIDVTSHFSVIPLIGFYKPEKSAVEGGSQVGDNRTNRYAQLSFFVNF